MLVRLLILRRYANVFQTSLSAYLFQYVTMSTDLRELLQHFPMLPVCIQVLLPAAGNTELWHYEKEFVGRSHLGLFPIILLFKGSLWHRLFWALNQSQRRVLSVTVAVGLPGVGVLWIFLWQYASLTNPFPPLTASSDKQISSSFIYQTSARGEQIELVR